MVEPPLNTGPEQGRGTAFFAFARPADPKGATVAFVILVESFHPALLWFHHDEPRLRPSLSPIADPAFLLLNGKSSILNLDGWGDG